VEVWVSAADITKVAFEVLHVNSVEADDCCEEADVLLSEAVAEVERTAGLGEICLCAIQRAEELSNGLLVSFLSTAGMLVQTQDEGVQQGRPTWQSQTCRHRC